MKLKFFSISFQGGIFGEQDIEKQIAFQVATQLLEHKVTPVTKIVDLDNIHEVSKTVCSILEEGVVGNKH